MVYAMVVAPAAANVFFALQLLDPITRLLIAASRGVEVTPDKLTKRYSEVWHTARKEYPHGMMCLEVLILAEVPAGGARALHRAK